MFGTSEDKISKMAEKKQSAKLAKLVEDKHPETRLAAIDALGRCGDDEAYNALVPLVHAPDVTTRVHAIRALAQTGNAHARVHIEHQAQTERDPQVLEAIKAALKALHSGE